MNEADLAAMPEEVEQPSAAQSPDLLPFQDWVERTRPSEDDPLGKFRGYSGYVRQSLLERGEWNDNLVGKIDERLAGLAVESGAYTPQEGRETLVGDVLAAPPEAALPAEDLLDYSHTIEPGEAGPRRTAAAKFIALRDGGPSIALNPEDYATRMAAAEAEIRTAFTPEDMLAARKESVKSGKSLATLVRTPEGYDDVEVSDSLLEYVNDDGTLDDKGLALALKLKGTDPMLIPGIRAKLSTPEGFTKPLSVIQKSSENRASLDALATAPDEITGFRFDETVQKIADGITRGEDPDSWKWIDDTAMFEAKRRVRGTPLADIPDADLRTQMIDLAKTRLNPEIDPENPAASIQKLSTGEVVIPPAVMLNDGYFEKAVNDSSVPVTQREGLRRNRELFTEAAAFPVTTILANDPQGGEEFLAYQEAELAKGKKQSEIVRGWISGGNFSATELYARGIGSSVPEAVRSLVFALPAMAGNEYSLEVLRADQQADASRRAYAEQFGFKPGIGYDLGRLVAPVAVDLLVSKGIAAGATTAAKATAGGAVKSFIRNAVNAETKGLVQSWARGAASSQAVKLGAAKGIQLTAPEVIALAGRDVATKFSSGVANTAFAATAYARSAGSTYASISGALSQETNPDGSAKYTPEEVKEISFAHANASGLFTVATTMLFQAAGRGGMESILNSKLTNTQLRKVAARLGKDVAGITDDVTVQKFLHETYRKTVSPFLSGAKDEAAEEFIQSGFDHINEKLATGEPINIPALFKEAGYGALLGGVMGGTVSKVGDTLQSRQQVDANTEADIRRTRLLEVATKLQETSPKTAQVLRNYAFNQRRTVPQIRAKEAELAAATTPEEKTRITGEIQDLNAQAQTDPLEEILGTPNLGETRSNLGETTETGIPVSPEQINEPDTTQENIPEAPAEGRTEPQAGDEGMAPRRRISDRSLATPAGARMRTRESLIAEIEMETGGEQEPAQTAPETPGVSEVPLTRETLTPEQQTEVARLEDLQLRKGQSENKVKGVKFSKKDLAEFETLAAKYRSLYVTHVDPTTDENLGDNDRGEPIYWSPAAKTHYSISDGRVRTAPYTGGLSDAASDRLMSLIESPTEPTGTLPEGQTAPKGKGAVTPPKRNLSAYRDTLIERIDAETDPAKVEKLTELKDETENMMLESAKELAAHPLSADPVDIVEVAEARGVTMAEVVRNDLTDPVAEVQSDSTNENDTTRDSRENTGDGADAVGTASTTGRPDGGVDPAASTSGQGGVRNVRDEPGDDDGGVSQSGNPQLPPNGRDKTYEGLLKKGTPAGPNMVELADKQVTSVVRNKLRSDRDTQRGLPGRPEETPSFYLRPKADVTGVATDRGWILKDKRPDFLTRFAPTPSPTQETPISDILTEVPPDYPVTPDAAKLVAAATVHPGGLANALHASPAAREAAAALLAAKGVATDGMTATDLAVIGEGELKADAVIAGLAGTDVRETGTSVVDSDLEARVENDGFVRLARKAVDEAQARVLEAERAIESMNVKKGEAKAELDRVNEEVKNLVAKGYTKEEATSPFMGVGAELRTAKSRNAMAAAAVKGANTQLEKAKADLQEKQKNLDETRARKTRQYKSEARNLPSGDTPANTVQSELNAFGISDGIPTFLANVAKRGGKNYGPIAKLLLDAGAGNVEVRIVNLPNTDAAGFYVGSNGVVHINTARNGPRGAVDTVLHELLHAVTEDSLRNPTPAQQKVIDRINRVRKSVMKRAKGSEMQYALGNASEFVTHFFTSPQFRDSIAAMTPKSEKNWVQVIADLIADLIHGRLRTKAERMSDSLRKDLTTLIQSPTKGLNSGDMIRSLPSDRTPAPDFKAAEEKFNNQVNEYVTGEWPADSAGRYDALMSFAGQWAATYAGVVVRVEGSPQTRSGYTLSTSGTPTVRTGGTTPIPVSQRDNRGIPLTIIPDTGTTSRLRLSETNTPEIELRGGNAFRISQVEGITEAEAKRLIASEVNEEVIHYLHFEEVRKRMGADTTDTEVAEEIRATYLEMFNHPDSETREAFVRYAYESYITYTKQEPDAETSENPEPLMRYMMLDNPDYPHVAYVAAYEAVRQIIQARAFGTLSEARFVPLGERVIQWFKDRLVAIRRFASRTEVLGERMERDILETERALNELRGVRLQPATARDVARFNQLTESLYQGRDSATAAEIEAFREANPEAWAELSRMREDVLREMGYDVGPLWHGTQPDTQDFTVFDETRGGREGFHFGSKISAWERLMDVSRGSISETQMREFLLRGKRVQITDTKQRNGATDIALQLENRGDITIQDWGTVEAAERKRNLQIGYPTAKQPVDSIRREDADYVRRKEALLGRELMSPEAELVRIMGEPTVFEYTNLSEGTGDTSYVVFDPSQIKSADPLTPGQKITPDRWADAASPDIRFQPSTVLRNLSDFRVEPPSDNVVQVANANDLTVSSENAEVPVRDLIGGVNVSQTSERKRVDALKEKILSEDGFISRIIVDGQNQVVEGQHRLQALQELGFDNAPVVILKGIQDFIPSEMAVKNILRENGVAPSDRVQNLMQNLGEIIADEKGKVEELRFYQAPAGYEKAWNAAVEKIIRQNESSNIRNQPASTEPFTPDRIADTVTGFLPDGITPDDIGIDLAQLAEDVSELNPVNAENYVHAITNRELAKHIARKTLGDDVPESEVTRITDAYELITRGRLEGARMAHFRTNPTALARLIGFLKEAITSMYGRLTARYDNGTAMLVNRLTRELANARTGFNHDIRSDRGWEPGLRMQPVFTTPAFYSQLERVVEAKIPNRATPEQIMATVNAAGVKAEEVKWSGIEAALPNLAVDGKVPKEALMKYLRDEGSVKFEEVTLGKGIQARYTAVRFGNIPQDRRYEVPGNEEADLMDWVLMDGGSPSYLIGEPDIATESEALSFMDAEMLDEGDSIAAAKFGQYVLPGGENYREVVLAMPMPTVRETGAAKIAGYEVAPYDDTLILALDQNGNALGMGATEQEARTDAERQGQIGKPSTTRDYYTSSHFPDVPNYVAHMRTNERDGGLFIEEIQSDRHQAGRKQGYREERDMSKDNLSAKLVATEYTKYWSVTSANGDEVYRIVNNFDEYTEDQAIDEAVRRDKSGDITGGAAAIKGIADAPFRTTWPLAMFKRALRDAVEGGKDWIGWTVGETQGDRFDLSKQVDAISVDRMDNGRFNVDVKPLGRSEWEDSGRGLDEARLADTIGKDLAQKVIDGTNSENTRMQMKGDQLKVESAGMKGFYDNMLPKEIGKYVKQWGGKVQKSFISQEMDYKEWRESKKLPATRDTLDQYEAEKTAGFSTSIWRIDITPEMRESVSTQGQVLFLPSTTLPSAQSLTEAESARSGFVTLYENDPSMLSTADRPAQKTKAGQWFYGQFVSSQAGVAESMTNAKVRRDATFRAIEATLQNLAGHVQRAVAAEQTDVDTVRVAMGNTDPLITEAAATRIENDYKNFIADSEADIARERKEMFPEYRDTLDRMLSAADKQMADATTDEQRAKAEEARERAYTAAEAAFNRAYDANAGLRAESDKFFDESMAAVAEDAEKFRSREIVKETKAETAKRKADQLAALNRLSVTSPDTYEAVLEARKFINDLQREVSRISDDRPEFKAIVDNSMGIYLVRSYRIHQDPKMAEKILNPKEPELIAAKEGFIKYLTPIAEEQIFRELERDPEFLKSVENPGDYDATIAAMRNHASELADSRAVSLFEDFILGHTDSVSPMGGSSVSNELARYMKKANLPEEMQRVLQVNTDPVFNMAYTGLSLGRLIVNQKLLTSIRDSGVDSGRFITEAEKVSGVTFAKGRETMRKVFSEEGNDDLKADVKDKLFVTLRAALNSRFNAGVIQEKPEAEEVARRLDEAFTYFAEGGNLGTALPEIGASADRIATDHFITSRRLGVAVKSMMLPEPGRFRNYQPVVSPNEGNAAFRPLGGLWASQEDGVAFRAAFKTGRKADEDASHKLLGQVKKTLVGAAGASLAVVTLGNPGYYGRNILGGLIMAASQGVDFTNMDNWGAAARFLKSAVTPSGEISPEFQELIAGRIVYDGAQIDYLRQLLDEAGISPEKGLEDLMLTAHEADTALGKAAKKGKGAYKALVGKLGQFAEASEVMSAVMVYTDFKAKLKEANFGTDKEIMQEASRLTKMVMPSKSEASSIVSAFSGSALGAIMAPFLRFKADVIRNTVNTPKLAMEWIRSDNPVLQKYGRRKMAAFIGVYGLFTAAMPIIVQRLIMGITDDEDEAIRASLPIYLRNASLYYFKNEEGVRIANASYTNPLSFSMDPLSRMGDSLIAAAVNRDASELAELPAIMGRFIAEDFIGENIVAGKVMDTRRNRDDNGFPIYLESDTDTMKAYKAAKHIIGGSYNPKVLSQGVKLWESTQRNTDEADFWYQPLGVAAATVAPFRVMANSYDDIERKAFASKRRQLGELWQITSKIFSPQPVSSEEMIELYEDRVEATDRINAETLKFAKAFTELRGGDEREVEKNMVDAGISKKKARLLIGAGVSERLVFSKEQMQDAYEKHGDAARDLFDHILTTRPRLIPVDEK